MPVERQNNKYQHGERERGQGYHKKGEFEILLMELINKQTTDWDKDQLTCMKLNDEETILNSMNTYKQLSKCFDNVKWFLSI